MAVGFSVYFYWYQVGTGDFLHSFFSTIAYHLESGNWGSKYPIIMKELYSGCLKKEHVNSALNELQLIVQGLKKISYKKVIWDIEDISIRPPWGDNISPDITDLSNYFITSDGDNLITILEHSLKKAKELKCDMRIKSI